MIHPSQLKIEGRKEIKGGQHVGCPTPEVTITHLPTGSMVSVKDGRSMFEVKEIALEALEYILRSMRWTAQMLESEL